LAFGAEVFFLVAMENRLSPRGALAKRLREGNDAKFPWKP
jgi:hypothetical protein